MRERNSSFREQDRFVKVTHCSQYRYIIILSTCFNWFRGEISNGDSLIDEYMKSHISHIWITDLDVIVKEVSMRSESGNEELPPIMQANECPPHFDTQVSPQASKLQSSPVPYCVARAPLLHLRSWVAIPFKVCQLSTHSGAHCI